MAREVASILAPLATDVAAQHILAGNEELIFPHGTPASEHLVLPCEVNNHSSTPADTAVTGSVPVSPMSRNDDEEFEDADAILESHTKKVELNGIAGLATFSEVP